MVIKLALNSMETEDKHINKGKNWNCNLFSPQEQLKENYKAQEKTLYNFKGRVIKSKAI